MLVLGAGSIGTLFACEAARRLPAHHLPVTLLVRNRLAYGGMAPRIVPNGEESTPPLSNNIRIAEAGDLQGKHFTVALFASKQHDLQDLSRTMLQHHCSADVGVSLCNGLGAVDKLVAGGAKLAEVLPAVTYAAAKMGGGHRGEVVRTNSASAAVVPTIMPRPASSSSHLAASMLELAIPDLVFAGSREEMDRAVWKKLLANVVINPLTALFNIRNGEVPLVCGEFIPDLVQEFSLVCPVKDLLGSSSSSSQSHMEEFIASVCELTAANTSSMLADVQHGRRTEIDALNGALVDLARRNGGGARLLPTHEFLLRSIHALEKKKKKLR